LNRNYMIAFLIGYGYKLEEIQALSDSELKEIINKLLNKID